MRQNNLLNFNNCFKISIYIQVSLIYHFLLPQKSNFLTSLLVQTARFVNFFNEFFKCKRSCGTPLIFDIPNFINVKKCACLFLTATHFLKQPSFRQQGIVKQNLSKSKNNVPTYWSDVSLNCILSQPKAIFVNKVECGEIIRKKHPYTIFSASFLSLRNFNKTHQKKTFCELA